MSIRSTNPKDILASSKAPLELVPMSMVLYAAMQMKNGAAKYGAHNYRGTGVRSSVYYAGLLRHLLDWFNGNEVDEEGVPNMAGICANLAILADAYAHGYLIDDRPPKVDMRFLIEQVEAEAKATNERHAGKSPKHYDIRDETFDASPRVPLDPVQALAQAQQGPEVVFTPNIIYGPLEVPRSLKDIGPFPTLRMAEDFHDSRPIPPAASRYPDDLCLAAEPLDLDEPKLTALEERLERDKRKQFEASLKNHEQERTFARLDRHPARADGS